MRRLRHPSLLVAALVLCAGTSGDPERSSAPPPSPKPLRPANDILFSDEFSGSDLSPWKADRVGIWTERRGVVRADLPDIKQEHSFLYVGSSDWTDYAVDVDVCA